jgi:hypothetical protein
LVRPTSLILAYRERAAGTGVSIVPRIEPQAIMVIVLIATPIAAAAGASVRAADTAANLFDRVAVYRREVSRTRHHSRLGFPDDGGNSDECRSG